MIRALITTCSSGVGSGGGGCGYPLGKRVRFPIRTTWVTNGADNFEFNVYGSNRSRKAEIEDVPKPRVAMIAFDAKRSLVESISATIAKGGSTRLQAWSGISSAATLDEAPKDGETDEVDEEKEREWAKGVGKDPTSVDTLELEVARGVAGGGVGDGIGDEVRVA